MGNFGFSWIGLIWLLMLMVPNILWSKRKPENYSPEDENKILVIFERAGEVLTTLCLVIFSDTNIYTVDIWSIWFFSALFFMLLYEVCWIRYFKKPTMQNFYGKFLFIPVPLALLPCLSIALLAVYGKLLWLGLAILLMSIGHIGIHISHQKSLSKNIS